MGWFSRNIGWIKDLAGTAALLIGGPAASAAIVAALDKANDWFGKFQDVELSPADAAILDPWVIKYHSFYEKLLKLIVNAQNAADLNTIKSYCCTMMNQYQWKDMNLSRDGLTARDNFINKTFSALDAGIHVRAQQLNIPDGKYWANVSTASYNDPIYNGSLIIEDIECEHYTAGQNMQPTPTPTPLPSPTPVPVVPTKPLPGFHQNKPAEDIYGEYNGTIPTVPTGCASGDCSTEIKPNNIVKVPTPSGPTHYEPVKPNQQDALDAEVLEEDQEEDGNFFSRNKVAISVLAALIVAKQLFSKK